MCGLLLTHWRHLSFLNRRTGKYASDLGIAGEMATFRHLSQTRRNPSRECAQCQYSQNCAHTTRNDFPQTGMKEINSFGEHCDDENKP
jgi:hypothetical protein